MVRTAQEHVIKVVIMTGFGCCAVRPAVHEVLREHRHVRQMNQETLASDAAKPEWEHPSSSKLDIHRKYTKFYIHTHT